MKLPVDYTKLSWRERRDVRLEYIILQNGRCYHCQEKLDNDPSKEVLYLPVKRELFPPNFFEHRVHLHHNHNTGMTIGAVHNHCNAVLWQYYGE